MSSGCISNSAVGCVDSRVPVRATYVSLYKWPESDAEFVKSVTRRSAGGGGCGGGAGGLNYKRCHPRVVDGYSCRQMYLRSYTFSKKESVPERTRKCLGKVKERVVVVVHTNRKKGIGVRGGGGGDGGGSGGGSSSGVGGEDDYRSEGKKRKKSCRAVKRLRSTLCSIFHRILSCTTSVDVVDR